MNCLACSRPLDSKKKVKYCCKQCGVIWRNRHVYSNKYHAISRSKTPRRFLASILSKKRLQRQNLTIDFLVELWNKQRGRCAISGTPMTHQAGHGRIDTNVSLDRVEAGKPYTEENVQLVCHKINIMKWTGTVDELKLWSRRVLEPLV